MFRSTLRTIVFKRPFFLVGAGTEQAAGAYVVETCEELLGSVSVTAYRRVATLLYLHEVPGDSRVTGVATIDPDELEAALIRDFSAP